MNATDAGLDRFSAQWPPREGRTLVVGSKCYGGKADRRLLYPDAVGLDQFEGEGVDIVHDLERALPRRVGRFEHVDCVSVLEHVRRPWLLAANVERVMVDGATILVCVPFTWRIHAYPNDYWRMTAASLEVLFPSVTWLATGYLVEGKHCKLIPRKNDSHGRRWLARSELVAAGVKCASTS